MQWRRVAATILLVVAGLVLAQGGCAPSVGLREPQAGGTTAPSGTSVSLAPDLADSPAPDAVDSSAPDAVDSSAPDAVDSSAPDAAVDSVPASPDGPAPDAAMSPAPANTDNPELVSPEAANTATA